MTTPIHVFCFLVDFKRYSRLNRLREVRPRGGFLAIDMIHGSLLLDNSIHEFIVLFLYLLSALTGHPVLPTSSLSCGEHQSNSTDFPVLGAHALHCIILAFTNHPFYSPPTPTLITSYRLVNDSTASLTPSKPDRRHRSRKSDC